MVSDKKIHRAFRIHTTLQTNPIREIYIIFTIYQNYTLNLKFPPQNSYKYFQEKEWLLKVERSLQNF